MRLQSHPPACAQASLACPVKHDIAATGRAVAVTTGTASLFTAKPGRADDQPGEKVAYLAPLRSGSVTSDAHSKITNDRTR